jgi:signal transduction histidine kinase
VIAQVAVAGLVGVLLVGAAGLVISRRLAERQAVHDAAQTTDVLAESVVQPALTDAMTTNSSVAVSTLDVLVRARVLSSTLVRVKLWTPSGTILYSDEPRLIGQRFALEAEARTALTAPRSEADVSDLQRPENQFERSQGKLLEVYRPVWTPGGEPLLLETYFKYSSVTQRSADMWRAFMGIMISAITLVVILVLPLVWTLFERTRRAQQQRERLMERALDASRDERERIAATLHDGVVQQLAAASFTTAGAAEHAAATGDVDQAERLRDAAAMVRGSIAGVRSLLVDIYPPSLRDAGLDAALRDLISTTSARVPAVELSLSLDGLAANASSADVQEAVFRVAQEALRNAVDHAAANSIRVVLSSTGGSLRLDVVDDGTGFDTGSIKKRGLDAHFGLRLMTDVAASVGAWLSIRSTPGHGTLVRMEIR